MRVCVFQKIIAGKSYYLAKEIVSTERTYLKDLEVITVVSGNLIFAVKFNDIEEPLTKSDLYLGQFF